MLKITEADGLTARHPEGRNRSGQGAPFEEARLVHLCETRPERVVTMVAAAQRRGDEAWARRVVLVLVSGPAFSGALAGAVRHQTFSTSLHELDELIDGARLAVVEQLARQLPQIESLAQFRGWVRTVARRHVMSVTRLKREQARRRGESLQAESRDSGLPADFADPGVVSPEELCTGDWAIVKDALGSTGEVERTVIVSHLVSQETAVATVGLVRDRFGEQIRESSVARMSDAFLARCRAARD